MWTCTVCSESRFEAFDVAARHEKTCDGNPPPQSADDGDDMPKLSTVQKRADKGDADAMRLPAETVERSSKQVLLPETSMLKLHSINIHNNSQ